MRRGFALITLRDGTTADQTDGELSVLNERTRVKEGNGLTA